MIISAALTVISEAEFIAHPISAYASAGLSLIPSPMNITHAPSSW